MIAPCDCTNRNPPARFVRGLLALLATPFLLLAMLVIGFWLTTSGKLTAALVSGEGDRPVSTSPGPPIKRRLPWAPATRLFANFRDQ
jgi:hypothetical protein